MAKQSADGRAYLLDHSHLVHQICSNLVDAGVLLKSEITRYAAQLDRYGQDEILRVLVYSHELKELAEHA
ncbi:hypothetical protein ES703_81120 [subsurface metagenome]